jgi:hypothetical protein
MSEGDNRYLQPVSRTAQVITGVLSLLLGLILMAFSAFGILVASKDRDAPQGTGVLCAFGKLA